MSDVGSFRLSGTVAALRIVRSATPARGTPAPVNGKHKVVASESEGAFTATDLTNHVVACGTDLAIALVVIRPDLPDPAKVGLPKCDNSRSRLHWLSLRAPAWALIDISTKGMFADVAAGVEAAGSMPGVSPSIGGGKS
jgi:hypothetical protein